MPRKGQKQSEEAKRKIGEKNRINVSRLWKNPEYKERMSKAHLGQMPVNIPQLTLWARSEKNIIRLKKMTSEYKEKQRKNMKGYLCSSGYLNKKIYGKLKRIHRLVMENMIRRSLRISEVVHHWNEKRDDNRKENLCLFRHDSAHLRLHWFSRRHGINIETLKFDQPWLYSR